MLTPLQGVGVSQVVTNLIRQGILAFGFRRTHAMNVMFYAFCSALLIFLNVLYSGMTCWKMLQHMYCIPVCIRQVA